MIFRCLGLSLVSGLLSVLSANTVSQACQAPNDLVPALTPLNVRPGMLYCNLPHMQAKQGDRVRLHLFSLGTENGIHAPSVSASNLDWEARTFPIRSLLCETHVFTCVAFFWTDMQALAVSLGSAAASPLDRKRFPGGHRQLKLFLDSLTVCSCMHRCTDSNKTELVMATHGR